MDILLLRHRNVHAPSFFTDYLAGLEAATVELGHVPHTFEYERIGEVAPGEREALYRALAEAQPGMVIDLCCWGYALTQLRVWDGSGAGETMFDASDATYLGLLCDQPYYQPLAGVAARRLVFGVPDRGHPEQIAMTHPDLSGVRTLFVPPAARVQNDRSHSWRERDIEVLYVGNLQVEALDRLWRGAPDEKPCEALAERALAEPALPLYWHVAAMMREEGITADASTITAWLQRVEFYLRAHIRLDAVRAAVADGLRLHIVGNGWDRQSWPATVTLQPESDYLQVFELAGRSRIALDASTYHNGANDRVFNYALNGCITFTNADGYLGSVFGGTGVRCYKLDELELLAPAIRAVLSNPQSAEREAAAARALVKAEHTWLPRLQSMLDAV